MKQANSKEHIFGLINSSITPIPTKLPIKTKKVIQSISKSYSKLGIL